MNYQEFIKTKEEKPQDSGFDIARCELNNQLFDFQKDIVKWALKKGKAAIFTDCGLGKSFCQLEWAYQVQKYTGGKILILAPLAVSAQTKREGEKFNIKVNICESEDDVIDGINITNYEKIHKFNLDDFVGVILDESSILKSFTGKFRNEIIEGFKNTPYKLACTATPSPNDFTELGNHAEFLDVMTRTEMLSMYFVHDGGDTSKWRLKGHCKEVFWEWMSTWAVALENPNHAGYDDVSYELPKLNIQEVIVETAEEKKLLVVEQASSLKERREARKNSVNERLEKAKEIISGLEGGQFLVWCDFNYESELLKKNIKNSVEVKGSDKPDFKEKSLLGFSNKEVKILVTKPSIAGWGLNWQQCNNMIFFGISDSYEQFYQAVRRCWRFGQTKQVNVYVIIGERELNVLENIKRKQNEANEMKRSMLKYAKGIKEDYENKKIKKTEYKPKIKMDIPDWL